MSTGGGGGGGGGGIRVVMTETHLSVFHSVSNRARRKCRKCSRNSISSTARYAFNMFFFPSRTLYDFTTFTLHDLKDFYVVRATALHYNK